MRVASSSSNDRLPRGGWFRLWALVIGLVLLPLAGWEAWWRARGFGSGVDAVDESWILAFDQVPAATTVALGTSRIQAALDPDVFRAVAGGKPVVNLALPGNSPIPLLEYLADSTRFAGLAIVEILPLYALDAEQSGARRGIGLIARYGRDSVSPARMAENWLEVHLLQYLVYRKSQLLPGRLVETLRKGDPVEPGVMSMRPDRFAPVNQARLLPRRVWDSVEGFHGLEFPMVEHGGRPPDPAQFANLRGRILGAVDRIVARGGRVVLLYIAACGERRRIEERRYPRERYWDALVHETRATAIATEDHPELSRFACWDGSHIDRADAAAWTRAFAAVLQSKGVPPQR